MAHDTRSAPGDVVIALDPRPEAGRRARQALVDGGLAEDIAHAVDLLSTEVVANAVRHADIPEGGQIMFFAHLEGDFARVEVADPGAGFNPDAVEHGFGLRLVDKVASAWGVDATKGCRVWFEVDRRTRKFRRVLGADAP
jgi:anti-sigma regulatory factor (Ser/Thr protein kinase)